ncbi:M28 family peptidase [Tessaracoccus sp. O5.2]|uniref:M28 family peptidase n=1 Tax=Tessaracoccus sp. O5.2 TaxID=3157622 RepID=UPI0036DD0ED3
MVAVVTACAPAQGGGSDEPVEFAEMAAAAESGPAVGMGDRVFAHLGQFQAIADLNGGTRASGSAGHAAALDYVESVLRDAGYETVRVTLDAEHPSAGAADVTVLNGTPSDPGEVIAMVGSPVAGSLTAPLLATTDPTGCTASDYAQADSSIVLVQRGRCSFADKAHLAERAGAHLDSVAESPGINANASGVSVALAVAEELAARGAPGARFAFWDGTEQGVLGSTAYVQALDQAALRSACRGRSSTCPRPSRRTPATTAPATPCRPSTRPRCGRGWGPSPTRPWRPSLTSARARRRGPARSSRRCARRRPRCPTRR